MHGVLLKYVVIALGQRLPYPSSTSSQTCQNPARNVKLPQNIIFSIEDYSVRMNEERTDSDYNDQNKKGLYMYILAGITLIFVI